MKRNVRVLIYPDETGGYNVQCTDLAAYTQGDTLEEALSNMREALGLALEDEALNELGFVADRPGLAGDPEVIEPGRGGRKAHPMDGHGSAWQNRAQ